MSSPLLFLYATYSLFRLSLPFLFMYCVNVICFVFLLNFRFAFLSSVFCPALRFALRFPMFRCASYPLFWLCSASSLLSCFFELPFLSVSCRLRVVAYVGLVSFRTLFTLGVLSSARSVSVCCFLSALGTVFWVLSRSLVFPFVVCLFRTVVMLVSVLWLEYVPLLVEPL